MSGGKLINRQTVLDWSANFKNSKPSSFATDSAAISLEELEKFITEAKKNYPTDLTGIRIYFVQYPLPDEKANSLKDKILSAGNNLSQPSIVLVPVRAFDSSTGSGKDYTIGTSDAVYALAFSDPESTDPADTTVLCPPKCNS